MRRALLPLGLGAVLLAAPAAAQQTPPSLEQREFNKQMELNQRDDYRLRVQNTLRQKEALLAKQEAELAAWQKQVAATHQKLMAAAARASKPKTTEEPDPNAPPAEEEDPKALGDPKILSKEFESQTYYARIAREAVMATRREVASLRQIMSRMGGR